MFISASFLKINYGIDEMIAAFFVDREPPVDNLYWKGKLLYLRPTPGYLFIPLIVDLLYKLGIDRKQLLSEEFVGVMEQVGHISALEETGEITVDDAIQRCSDLVKDSCKNKRWHSSLLDFLYNGESNFFNPLSIPFKALHRGDLFLFSLSVLEFTSDMGDKIAEYWFALISTLLLLDDVEDIETDTKTGQPNAFLESGFDAAGIETIFEWVRRSVERLATLNQTMAHELHEQFTQLVNQPHILKRLNR
ncbi:MAG: hypothetical protein JWQ40_2322 [Segetibacter sp.]|nr:hypothetical protein [Segetibacter sp.]